tara:strand:+ start:287 stop:631 length:345 start_codon:yes stop_codon:yes gene_type:complete
MATLTGNVNFLFGGSDLIPLTAPIVTESLLIPTDDVNWAIQAIEITGTDGVPDLTIQVSLDDETFSDYSTVTSGVDITDIMFKQFTSVTMFFRISIALNTNTAGNCKIVLKGTS